MNRTEVTDAEKIAIPIVARMAGVWLIWCAWCNACGWLLSAADALNGTGYAVSFPVLLGAWLWWWRVTAPAVSMRVSALRIRGHGFLPWVFRAAALLSFIGGFIYLPWSFDAMSYRLPRILYWWSQNHWHWIGTLDERLDYSSCGFEWQMLPVLITTRSDRFLFLLNWLPLLMVPGLTFMAFRTLGVAARTAQNWMWLLPTGYCYMLQSGSIQNDGYAVNYVLAAIVFTGFAWRTRRPIFVAFAILACALMTAAKISNLVLLLPLGGVLLPALLRTRFLRSPTLTVLPVAALASFLPLAVLSIKYTGDWTGDPHDQWHVQPNSAAGAVVANIVLLANDTFQPPACPVADRLNRLFTGINSDTDPFFRWLRWSHHEFSGVSFNPLVYEGSVGLGFGVGLYTVFLLIGQFFTRKPVDAPWTEIPLAWQIAPWLAWISYLVFLSKVGFAHTPRHAAPFYPLLFISLVRLPRVARFDATPVAKVVRGLAALSVVPILLLTPVRPIIPPRVIIGLLSAAHQNSQASTMGDYYHFWANLRDDLAPMRNALPPNEKVIGYMGAFRDTAYGLWKPIGGRQIVELGLPLGTKPKIPPNIRYAVVTEEGVRQRYQIEFPAWLKSVQGQSVFEFQHRENLAAHETPKFEKWHLVNFDEGYGGR